VIRLFFAAARFQVLQMRRSPGDLLVLVTLPLLSVAFLSILVESGDRDLAPYAVVGTAVMSIWSIAVFISGGIIDTERRGGTLEAIVPTPAALSVIVVGRIMTVTVISLLGLPESILVAWAAFGIRIQVVHPAVFLLTLACTTIAVVGTATVMAGLFVLSRSAQTYQNSLTYPFYVLSGAVVPITYLPGWLQPVSKAVFLSWTSELLRASLLTAQPSRVPFQLAVILLLGVGAFGTGLLMINRVLNRLRRQGTVGQV